METKTVKYINVNGKLMDLSHPQVMGILNVTPDSFYAGSRQQTEKDIINRTSQIIEEGASIIDIGAYSSRPNAEHISPGVKPAWTSNPEGRIASSTLRNVLPTSAPPPE